MNLLQALFEQQQRQRANDGSGAALPGPLGALPAPVQQGLGLMRPLLQTLPGVGALASPVGQAVAQQTLPVGRDNLLMALQRVKQEWDTKTDDTVPNPLAGIRGGPAEVHYNPLRDVPVVGGAITSVANGPLRALGLTGEAAAKVGGTAAGEIALLTALAQVQAADLGVPGVDPDSDVTRSARAVVEQGWQHPGRAIHALRTGPDSTGAFLGGALELATDPRNYAGGVGALGQGLEASGKAPALGAALKNAAFLGEVSNRLPLAPLAALPRARAALLRLPEYMRPAEEAGAAVSPAVASILESAARQAEDVTPRPVATQAPLLAAAHALPTPLRPSMPLPFPTKRPVDVSARAADYLAGAGVPSRSANLLTALRDTPPLASGSLAAELPAASNAITPELPVAAAIPGGLQQRVLGMAMLKGDTPTIGEIQRELKVGVPEAVRLQDYARDGAAGRPGALANTPNPTPMLEQGFAAADNVAGTTDPTGLIEQAATPAVPTSSIRIDDAPPGAVGSPTGASAAAGLTARQEWLDTLTAMPSRDKGLLLRDLLNANYGGGGTNALRAVLGRGSVADEQAPEVLNWLIQRTTEDPQALAKLGQINPPLARAIPTVEPAALSATDLQNGLRSSLGLAPKGAAVSNPAQLPLSAAGQAADRGTGATGLVDQLGTAATDWRATAGPDAGELLNGIEDAVRRGAVDEAEALVAMAPDYGVPESRARAVLEAAADAGGSGGLADVQAQALEQSPYFSVFKYFNKDGALKKVNPRTGAPLLVREAGRLSQGRAEVWNIPGSGYDEVAAVALNDFGGYHPQWATNADDFWTQAREAFGQYQQLKGGWALAPRDFLGDWGTGGGMGITPFPGGLPSALQTRTLLGAGGGGLLGGASAGVTGYAQGDRGDTLLDDVTKGSLLGAGIGGAGGAALPKLEQATTAALAAARTAAPDLLDDTVLDPATLRLAGGKALAALRASTRGKGVAWHELPGMADAQWRSQVVATGKNLGQDAGNVALLVHEFGSEFNADRLDVKRTLGQLRDNLDHPDKVARYGETGTLLQDVGLDHLIAPQTGLRDLLGEDIISAATDKVGRGSLLQRAAIGTGIGFAHGVKDVAPVALLTGGIRGALDPYIATFFGTLNGLQHNAPRVAFLRTALERDLPDLATPFLADLRAAGVDTTGLEQLGGRFHPDDVKATVLATAGQTSRATQAAKDWALQTEGLARLHADRIAHLFGDFRDKGDAATLGDRAIAGISKVSPFASWRLKYAPVFAEMAARHPRLATGLLTTYLTDAENAKQEGRRGYTIGTVPITTEAPLLGAVARFRLGGKAGTWRPNPLELLAGPVGGELFAGDESEDGTQTGYQRVTGGLKRLGFSPHPLIQAAAYATGQDYQAPGSLSRTAGLDQLPQLLPGALGATMPSGRSLLDAARGVLEPAVSGAGIPTVSAGSSDPVMKRYAELVYATRGTPLKDPANRAYLTLSSPEAQALYAQAKRETILAGAGSTAMSLTLPVGSSAEGADAQAAQAARAPVLAAQNAVDQLPPIQGAALLQQIARYKQQNPASAVYDGTSAGARANLLLADWEAQNAQLERIAPSIFNYYRAMEQERLGMVAPGTNARKIAAIEADNAKPGQGQIMLLPGLPMSNDRSVGLGLRQAGQGNYGR